MNENDYNGFDVITRFQAYQAQRRNKKLFLFFSKITEIWQKPLKAVLWGVLRFIFSWEFEAFWIVQSWGTLTKLGALLKVCLLAWDINAFLIIIWRANSKQPDKIRYCILVKIMYFLGITWRSFVVFPCFLRKRRFFFYLEEAVVQMHSVACNFIKKETMAQVFSWEFFEISKNTFCYRTPPVAAPDH